MFPFIYTVLLTFFYIVLIPFLLIISFKNKYKRSIPSRFFLFKNPSFKDKTIHFHSCSLGETLSLKPLIESFDKVNLSVITDTGFEAARKYSNADVRFLPFEIFLWFWLKPGRVLVVTEAELWYLLFYLSKKRGGKTFLINARISDRSYKSYLRLRWFYKKIFENIDFVFAQTETDRERLKTLGAKNVEVAGNIKLAVKPVITKSYEKPKKRVIVAASTHEPEEEIIFTAWLKNNKDSVLVIVPRHPERFDEVDELLSSRCKAERLSYHRFSQKSSFDADVVLVDKMGELINIYTISDLVILGGSFVNVGGHNPLEPAFFNKPIISGKNIYNQKESYSYVGGIELIEADELEEVFEKKDFKPTKIVAKADIKKILKKIKEAYDVV
ncbi:lipid IV(A) 3-deoxy-D-manno-octulosonic acid transferase [Nitrosophilus labii]|uniref:lipid IV(A) 3-deoxy-D-manno-octulosonic acid transferase n=1 Tax=Nitrosophilus labii TaxID=2706014 RepID=UPI001656EEED|nr:lipid IV(A) 3-deoxy-D-manno-octulosonic acid transferase [Nitrosophilus labii]